MLNIKTFYFVLILLIFHTSLISDDAYSITCNNITKALELNTGIYNKCLFSNPGEKYPVDDLKNCKNEHLSVIERLSYVYKNICK